MTSLNITHEPGRHCASTGIRNLMAFHGIEMTEAMCFGIGQGLSIYLISAGKPLTSRIVHVRSADFEKQFFMNIGVPFQWETHEDPHESETLLVKRLDESRAAIIQTDIYYLPYFNTSTHFPGHVINVWGYDRAIAHFVVTDTERKYPIAVPMDQIRKARYCSSGFFDIKGHMFAPKRIIIAQELSDVIRNAIIMNSRFILNDQFDFSGRGALNKWITDIEGWHLLDDWRWTARFAYQVTEKRGTGGGAFRFLYADFLDESSRYLPQIKTYGLQEKMATVAKAWQEFSLSLKKVSEEEKPDFSDARDKLVLLADLEIAYHEESVKLFG